MATKKKKKNSKAKNNKIITSFNKIISFIKDKYNFIISKWNDFIELKYIRTIFKFFPRNLFVFIMFLLSIITAFKFMLNNENNALYIQSKSDTVYPPILVKEDTLHLPLKDVDTDRELGKVCYTFATYGKKNLNSVYKYSLIKGDETITEYVFNSKIIKDGEQHCFDISKADKDHLSDYEVLIEPMNSDSDNAITIFKNTELNEPMMIIKYKTKKLSWRNLTIVIFGIIFMIANYLINTKKISYEKMWLVYSLIYFLPIMLLIPPYQVPDEIIHQNTAKRLTSFYKYKNFNEMMADLNLKVYNQTCLDYSDPQFNDTVESATDVLNCLSKKEIVDYKSPVSFTSRKIAHIIPAVGIALFEKISASPLIVFMGGRLFNLLFSMFIIFFAIKITPKFKELFFVVGTIPMFVQQAVSYSYDSPLNCMSLLAIASMLKIIYSGESFKTNLKYYLLILISALFIYDIKWVYLPILLILLLKQSKNKSSGMGKYLLTALIAVIPFLLMYILSHYVGYFKLLPVSVSNASNKLTNYNYIMSNPKKLLPLAYNTLTINGMMYLRGIVGFFGWFSYRLNDVFILFYLLIFAYIICRNDFIKPKLINKIIMIVGVLVSISAVFAAMYFGWSPYQSDIVDGVQGRYFLPLLIPIVLIFITNKQKTKQVDETTIFTFSNIVLLQFIIEILIYLY